MKIILKYKKTFITIAIVAFIISILPAIGMLSFMGIGSSMVVVETTNTMDDTNSRDYQYFNIVAPTEPLNPPTFNSNGFEKTQYQNSFSTPTTEQVVLYEAYLEEGMIVTFDYRMNVKEGYLEFGIFDEEGMKMGFSGTNDSPSTIIDHSGNYVIAYNANNVKGSFSLEVRVKAVK